VTNLSFRLISTLGLISTAVWVLAGVFAGTAAWPATTQSGETAQFDSGEERLDRLQVAATLESDGDLMVEETIVWNFGSNRKRGIFRYIPNEFAVDPEFIKVPDPARRWTRVTKIDWLQVSSSSGAPTDTNIEINEGNSVLRIGDPEVFISGRHTYQLSYRINRAVVKDLLQYVAVGEGWTVPVDSVDIAISLPVEPSRAPQCLRGSTAELDCTVSTTVNGGTTTVRVQTTGVGVEVEIPLPESFASPDPQLETTRRLSDGFATSGADGALGLLAGIGAIGAAVAAGRSGRDRVFAHGGAIGSHGDAERRRRLGEKLATPVEFEPPEGIRPGLIDPARHGVAEQRSITATVVDLAARGILRIEPTDERGSDYVLTLTGRQEPVTPTESDLLGVLFSGTSGAVGLSSLHGRIELSSQMAVLRGRLLQEAVEHRWWNANPVFVRRRWRGYGIAAILLGAVLTFMLVTTSALGFVGVAVILLGIGLLIVAQTMPVRTAVGSRIEARLRGFELLFDAGEGDRLKLAERQNLFAEYLPYAVAFGNVDKWVKTFASLGIQPDVPYFGAMGHGPMFWGGAWGGGRGIEGALSDFDRSLDRSIEAGAEAERQRQAAASRESSGGGGGGSFGGGGSSGGGGGGSW
jgi:uncharacterized membrane protein YgcG